MSNEKNDQDFKAHATTWQLDAYEQEMLHAFESSAIQPLADKDMLIQASKDGAKCYFEKKARINIRLTDFDLKKLKRRAAAEGLPYQTLAASILHKYVHGTL